MALNGKQLEMCSQSQWDFSDLKALFISTTLKKSPETSHTEGLMRISMDIVDKNGVSTELIRLVDHKIASGVYPDMTQQGWNAAEWPGIYEKVKAAQILVVGTSI
jgi:multimeric flavodoxin WrbA